MTMYVYPNVVQCNSTSMSLLLLQYRATLLLVRLQVCNELYFGWFSANQRYVFPTAVNSFATCYNYMLHEMI